MVYSESLSAILYASHHDIAGACGKSGLDFGTPMRDDLDVQGRHEQFPGGAKPCEGTQHPLRARPRGRVGAAASSCQAGGAVRQP